MNKYQKALNLFTGYDQYREWAQEPHTQGEYVYASEGHVAIQIEKRLLEYDYSEIERPNFSSVFQVRQKMDEVMAFKDLMEVYKSIPYTTLEKCDACDGKGEVEYKFEYDCTTYTRSGEYPICGGQGMVEFRIPKKDFRYSVLLVDSYSAIKQCYFEVLVSAMHTLGADSVCLAGWNGSAFLFEVCEGVRILISAYVEDKCKTFVVKYKKEERHGGKNDPD